MRNHSIKYNTKAGILGVIIDVLSQREKVIY
jgi:hypothetical protein